MSTQRDPLQGLTVLERGWLSSNNILIRAAPGEAGATLVDTSHVNHAEQTVGLLRHALAGQPLAHIVNTHLHSDHCGGNAAVQQAFGAPITVPPGSADAVRNWHEPAMSWFITGQRMARFDWADLLHAGEPLRAGGRDWQVIAAPGHDPDSVMLFDAANGVLISADALWENGFGVVFPEIEGEPGFDDVGAVLDVIDRLPVRLVIPGHGRPFDDVKAALARARSRLAAFQANPARHAHHGLKVLIKYHLMEERQQPREDLLQWVADTPLLRALWQRHRPVGVASAGQWADKAVDELVGAGVLGLRAAVLVDV